MNGVKLGCFLVLLSLGLIQYAHATSCEAKVGGHHYDLSSLAGSTYKFVSTYQQSTYTFWLGVCGPAKSSACVETADVSGCQEWDATSKNGHAALGVSTQQSWEPLASGMGSKGVRLNYKGGKNSKSFEINFICGSGSGQPTFLDEDTTGHYIFSVETSAACGKGGLSGGGIFLIILLVVAVVYLVAGIIVKKVKYQATGADLIPNKDFWVSLPGLVKDGVKFLISKFRRGGYQQI